jgi:hypothetical protein
MGFGLVPFAQPVEFGAFGVYDVPELRPERYLRMNVVLEVNRFDGGCTCVMSGA